MKILEIVQEQWSNKYKRSINCASPKGFSQRAHCQGRKKHESYHSIKENFNSIDFPIANVRRPNGAIGTQGVTTDQVANVLTHIAGLPVSQDMSMKELVDLLKADPRAQQRLRQSLKQNPVHIQSLPDGTYHLKDGHHRTFLLNLLGDKTVPAVVEGIDANQRRARQVPGEEMPKPTGPILGKKQKQHPFKGRAVGGGI